MRVAFFDFDGTLLVRDSGVICAVPSIREGLLGPRIGARLIGTYLLAKAGLRTRADAQRVGFECYRGRSLDDLRRVMGTLHEQHLRRFVSPAVRRRLEQHRSAGDRIVVLTASAFFFAEPLCAELAIDDLVGTQVAFAEDGICTGRVQGPILDGKAKLEAAVRSAEAHHAPLERCVFYTDHIADLPLLEAVGEPVVVGSSRPLASIARRRGWEILPHGG
jgi:HAD superfamily hydrolase (TIGR01490 family)